MNHPGFIDLQVNGYSGVDFSDPATTDDQILQTAEILAQNGTVGFLATITTQPREIMEACVRTIASAIRKQSAHGFIRGVHGFIRGVHGFIRGIHIEGPFISPEYGYRGMHPADSVCAPD